MQDLENEAALIRAGTVSDKSRRIYQQSISRFLSWTGINKPHLMTQTFLENYGDVRDPDRLKKRIFDDITSGTLER